MWNTGRENEFQTSMQAFAAEEVKKKEAADAIVRKLNGRIRRADDESEVMMTSVKVY